MPDDRGAPALVLDTNVVLDWLVFRNPAVVTPLEPALADARWRWHATEAMLTELELVLTYPQIAGWQPDRSSIRAAWHRWAVVVPARPAAPSLPLRCTDPDDQMFIDLAMRLGGATLLSRDRALLKLARRARAHGVFILTPEHWSP
jgi:predicted nucleic acid-binding protein